MAVSFKEFRDRFPNASVLSDLLSVHEQHYIVKVTIATPEAGSATGLAADKTLEIAEDKARQRALQALGLEHSDTLSQAAATINDPQPSEISSISSSQEQEPSPVLPARSTALPEAASDELPSSLEPVASQATARSQPELEPAQPAIKTRAKVAHRMQSSPAPSELADAPTPTSTHPIPTAHQEPIAEAALPAPINLSDVIAQTDIELRRLGWTVEMGREYLDETYNKRSRLELSEEELIQFLCHLEGLPEPQTT